MIRQVQPPRFERPSRGQLVQVLHWEFGPLPPHWVRMIDDSADEVWAASTYVRDWMVDSGVPASRVRVVPLGVDAERFHPDATPTDLGEDAPGLRLLFVGGLHGRKGIDFLLDAYERMFRRDDDVTLVIKDFGARGPYPPGPFDERVRRMAASEHGPRVHYMSGPIGEEEMPGLYTACDCLIHPYRGEAYGLTIAEAMACGLPVIIPDGGAARGFTDADTALLVPSRQIEVIADEVSSYRMDRYPVVTEVDLARLGETMRGVYENYADAAAIGARASVSIRRDHTWEHTGAFVLDRVDALTGRVAARLSRGSASLQDFAERFVATDPQGAPAQGPRERAGEVESVERQDRPLPRLDPEDLGIVARVGHREDAAAVGEQQQRRVDDRGGGRGVHGGRIAGARRGRNACLRFRHPVGASAPAGV